MGGNQTNFLLAIIIISTWFFLIPILIPMIWFEKKIENIGLFYFFFTLIQHEVIWIACNLFFIILYKCQFNYVEQFKVQSQKWPWYQKDSWNKLLDSTIKVMLYNHFLVIPLALLPNMILDRSPFRMDNSFPTHLEFFYQISFFIICEDFFFYWSHRIFHTNQLYSLFHKVHHEYQNTISVAAEYAHPIEFFFGNIIPSQAGPFLLGKKVHILTNSMWILIRIWKTTEAHSGYDFPASPFGVFPFCSSSRFHNLHHFRFKGNYGSFFTFWDYLCGTLNKKYIFNNDSRELATNPNEKKKTK
jgi:sterol desaturase/sphingolipid hydroxylase (fatty acid hydroxylase superfamily)